MMGYFTTVLILLKLRGLCNPQKGNGHYFGPIEWSINSSRNISKNSFVESIDCEGLSPGHTVTILATIYHNCNSRGESL